MIRPPKPQGRTGEVSLWRHARLFRDDILSAQPQRLFRAWMAEFRTPFFRSYLVNQPDLVRLVLRDRPGDFPKSARVSEGLRPLLGDAVFLTNGEAWARQRRIIDPAFDRGRLGSVLPAIAASAEAAATRLASRSGQEVEIEEVASHAAADVIFRTLFSIPIEDETARAVYAAFRTYQRSQPILNPAALVPMPRWVPRWHGRAARRSARDIRRLIAGMTRARAAEIARGVAPDDLATRIMTTPDPVTGHPFSTEEMVDQVAIFFLAGHETSAAALAWALYLLAADSEWQDRVADEAARMGPGPTEGAAQLPLCRDVFRETLRLYPPVPMMVRETTRPERFRDRDIAPGAQVVVSPWNLHRHERMWQDPDIFDPGRWQTSAGKMSAREAYIPFSAGPRACPGAGFAMMEGPLILARLLRDLRMETIPGRTPVPVAHLTVRSKSGIYLRVVCR